MCLCVRLSCGVDDFVCVVVFVLLRAFVCVGLVLLACLFFSDSFHDVGFCCLFACFPCCVYCFCLWCLIVVLFRLI